jgi:hypothetical protein
LGVIKIKIVVPTPPPQTFLGVTQATTQVPGHRVSKWLRHWEIIVSGPSTLFHVAWNQVIQVKR